MVSKRYQKGFSDVPYGVRNVSGGCQVVSGRVIWSHKSVRKVSDGIRNVSCVFRNLSDGARKVSGGVRRMSGRCQIVTLRCQEGVRL